MLQPNCLSCGANVSLDKPWICTICGFGQQVELPNDRYGLCQCGDSAGKIIICVVSGFADKGSRGFCSRCVPYRAAFALAKLILKSTSMFDYGTLQHRNAIQRLSQTQYFSDLPPPDQLEALEALIAVYMYRKSHHHSFID